MRAAIGMQLSPSVAPPALRHRVLPLNAFSAASPVHRTVRLPNCRLPNRHRISTRVAAEETEAAISEVAQPSAADEQPQDAPPDENEPLDPEVAAEIDADELDDAQESLLKWMLFKDDQEQEDDLDEMIDYSEFGAEEYEELYEELEEAFDVFDYNLKTGDKVQGTVIEVDDDGAYVDVGAKGSAFMPLQEASFARLKTALEVVRPGMKREFLVVGDEDEYGQLIVSLGAMECTTFWKRMQQLQEEEVTVYVTVESANKGGLLVKYGQYEGFVPVSQFGPLITLDAMDSLVGYDIPAKFLEINEEDEKLVFSNRRASSAPTEIQGYTPGQVVTGIVQSVKPYGAFIDLGGVTGLLHVSQISHERIASVDKILNEGDKLKVMILSMDRDRGRVTLSTKKLEPTPGDMLRDPQLVFEKAEEMAENFRKRVENSELMGAQGGPLDMDASYAYDAQGGPLDLSTADGGQFIM